VVEPEIHDPPTEAVQCRLTIMLPSAKDGKFYNKI